MNFSEFWILIVAICFFSGFLIQFSIFRYAHVINPISLFFIFDIGVLTLLSAVVARELNGDQEVGLTSVLYLTIVYMGGFLLASIPRRFHLPCRLFNGLLSVVGKSANLPKYSHLNQLFLIALTFGLFFLLMQASGAGMLWITDSRLAYQSYRAGVGLIYLLVQWTLLASLLYYLWTKNPKLPELFFLVFIYSIMAYFTGSKANILFGAILSGIYYNFFIKRISTSLFLLAPFITLGIFLVLLLLQGSYSDTFSAISYFRDYTETTGKFLLRFDEFELQWGYGVLSDLWFYVPRALYSDKPFEYGIVLIHKVLFPGGAEQGHTPGVLPWALSYLDFGAVGVFIFGFIAGFVRRGAYESFLNNQKSIFAFVIMAQLSLIGIFAYATLPLITAIAIFLDLFVRKRIVFFSSARS